MYHTSVHHTPYTTQHGAYTHYLPSAFLILIMHVACVPPNSFYTSFGGGLMTLISSLAYFQVISFDSFLSLFKFSLMHNSLSRSRIQFISYTPNIRAIVYILWDRFDWWHLPFGIVFVSRTYGLCVGCRLSAVACCCWFFVTAIQYSHTFLFSHFE